MEWIRDGRAATTLGDVVIDGDDNCASLIAKGEHQKAYHYTDPNEDALYVLNDNEQTILSVADGHRGWIASAIAVGHWGLWALEQGDWNDKQLVQGLWSTNEAVLNGSACHPRIAESRTTFVGARIAKGRVQWASFGDSSVWTIDGDTITTPNQHEHMFLGWPMTLHEINDRSHWGECVFGDWVILCSDGISEFVSNTVVAEHLRQYDKDSSARDICTGLYQLTSQHGAGDNVTVVAYANR